MGSRNSKLYQKKLFGTWQFVKIDVLVDFIIEKFARLKSKYFSHFFWWEVNLRGLRAFILQKLQATFVERQKKKFCHPSLSIGKEDTLIILSSAWDQGVHWRPDAIVFVLVFSCSILIILVRIYFSKVGEKVLAYCSWPDCYISYVSAHNSYQKIHQGAHNVM